MNFVVVSVSIVSFRCEIIAHFFSIKFRTSLLLIDFPPEKVLIGGCWSDQELSVFIALLILMEVVWGGTFQSGWHSDG